MERTSGLAVILIGAGLLAGCGGDDSETQGASETDDATANEAILAELPRYPSATVYDKSVNPYYPGDGGGAEPLGHTTNVSYRVPEDTDQLAVISFYSARVQPEWRCHKERIRAFRLPSAPPGTPGSRAPKQAGSRLDVVILNCRRRAALLSVNPDNLGSTPPRYEVVVDHNDRT